MIRLPLPRSAAMPPRVSLALALLLPLAATAASPDNPLPRLDPATVLSDARQVTPETYPDADDVLVDNLVHERYEADGRSVTLDDEYVKVLTEKGRRESLNRRFHFSLPYDTVTVVRAEIWKPDGACVTVDVARASRVMTETGQMQQNIYDPNNKLLQLSLAGLEIGDVIHVLTGREALKPRVPGLWADHTLFEYTSPIRRLTYEIDAPADRPLWHRQLRDALSNSVVYASEPLPGGGMRHRWSARDVPQMFPEPNMPPLHVSVQRLLLSTAEDWPALSRWYWELCQPRLAAVTPEMRETVSGVVARAATRDERVRRLFTWVSQNVRYMGITTETEAPGYEPHDVSMTFSNRYGVCRDKAALLVAMLRLADVEAYPVLIHAGAKLDPDVPVPFFNHAIVAAARPDGSYELMDPTNESARDLLPSYLCNRSYLVAHPRGEPLRVSPVVAATQNLVRILSRGDIDAQGLLRLETEIAFEGINDTVYRGFFVRQKEDSRRLFFEGLVKRRLAGAELSAFELLPADLQDTDQPLRARFTSRVRDYPVRGDGLDLLDLPWLADSVGYVNFVLGRTGLQQRRYTLETEVACGADETIELDLGAAVGAPLQVPQTVETGRVGVAYARQVTVTNGVLRGSLRFLLERPEYPAADYAALKDMLRDREYASRQQALFAPRDADAGSDVRVLDDTLLVDVASPHAWQSTHRWTQRILTYAGKKKYAEVKLPFNPAWQSAELVSAVVSNLDGSVRTVSPAEINLMDAPWAGGAPRYPAGKVLVVSLPGVETGSVISVCTRTTQRDAPFFSLQAGFRRFEPVEAACVELRVPEALPLRLRAPAGGVEQSCTTAEGRRHYVWHSGPQPAVPVEDSLPPWHAFTPVLLASAGDWPAYTAHLSADIERAAGADTAAAALARSLVRGVREPRERAVLLRNHVARAIRRAGPSFDELPPGFTPADVTLADGYGHAADRAILLLAMLRAAELRAEPLLAADAWLDAPLVDVLCDVPQRNVFDNLLVAVRPPAGWLSRLFAPGATARASLVGDGLPLLLNDTDQYAEPGTAARFHHLALTLDGTRKRVEVPAAFRPFDRDEWTLDLAADGLARIAVTNWIGGTACGDFRRLYAEMPPEERSRHYQELVGAVSQAAEAVGDLDTDLTAYPARRAYTVRAERYAVRDGSTLTLALPGGELQVAGLRADTRLNPLHVTGIEDTEWICHVRLPAGVADVPVLPPDVDWTLPAGLGHVRCTTTQARLADGRLLVTLRRSLQRGEAVLAPELYPALLEMNRRLAHPSMRTLVARLE